MCTGWRREVFMDSMEQRREDIVRFVNENGTISFQMLKKQFPNVSEMTLRTDLKLLNEEHKIVRIHGGAKSVHVVIGTDDLFGNRAVRSQREKEIIAEKAAGLIRENMTLYLDSGSTATVLARMIPDLPLIIFTSGISCATEMARLTKASVSVPGGKLNRYSMSVCGIEGIRKLEKTGFDLVLMGVTSFSEDIGFSCGVEEESYLKQAALRNAAVKAVLMDSSKIGTRRSFSICGLEDIDILVSDGNLPEDFCALCLEKGVTVL